MWSDLQTVPQLLDCKPPFSFFYDLVEVHWRTNSPPSNRFPFHRICTLARKQGATLVTVESALTRAEVREEIDDLDIAHGGGGAAEALSFTFLRLDASPAPDLSGIPNQAIIGQATIINYRQPGSSAFTLSYVYEAILVPPTVPARDGSRRGLMNNGVNGCQSFPIVAKGNLFEIYGAYYAQQNGTTSVCAHACLRMALNATGIRPLISTRRVNQILGASPPFQGLTVQQIADVISAVGLEPSVYDFTPLSKAAYLSAVASIIESGDMTLLNFTTAGTAEHVVSAFGYTRNSDEWHPQALPAYVGAPSAQHYPVNAWIDHYLVHDDNFGPFFALNARAFEVDPSVRAHYVVAIRKSRLRANPAYAEALSAIILANMLPSLASVTRGRWFDHITRTQRAYVTRAISLTRDQYIAHLTSLIAHDGTKIAPSEIVALSALPAELWMVEFSEPPLFTGNHSKLGEVVLDGTQVPDATHQAKLFLALRLPSLMVLADPAGGTINQPLSLTSHAPLYKAFQFDTEW